MSASLLLTIICTALLIQVLAVLFVTLGRRSRDNTLVVAEAPKAMPIASGAWAGWRDFRIAGRHFEDIAQTQCSFHLEPVDQVPLLDYLPGQFLTLSLSVADGHTVTRCYSLSDAPNASRYRITVKRVLAPAGRSDIPPGECSHFLHDKVKVGDVVKVKAPAGHFVLDTESDTPIVMIAGGIGITPLLSMLQGGLAAMTKTKFHL